MFAHGIYSTALTPLDVLDNLDNLEPDNLGNPDDEDIDVDSDGIADQDHEMDSSSGQLSSALSTPAVSRSDTSGISNPAKYFDALDGSNAKVDRGFNGGCSCTCKLKHS
jgi:putative hemolysin